MNQNQDDQLKAQKWILAKVIHIHRTIGDSDTLVDLVRWSHIKEASSSSSSSSTSSSSSSSTSLQRSTLWKAVKLHGARVKPSLKFTKCMTPSSLVTSSSSSVLQGSGGEQQSAVVPVVAVVAPPAVLPSTPKLPVKRSTKISLSGLYGHPHKTTLSRKRKNLEGGAHGSMRGSSSSSSSSSSTQLALRGNWHQTTTPQASRFSSSSSAFSSSAFSSSAFSSSSSSSSFSSSSSSFFNSCYNKSITPGVRGLRNVGNTCYVSCFSDLMCQYICILVDSLTILLLCSFLREHFVSLHR